MIHPAGVGSWDGTTARCDTLETRWAVVTFMLPRRMRPRMDRNQIIALTFAVLMATSMIAWGALAAF